MSSCSQAEIVIDKPLLSPEYLGFNDGTARTLFTSKRYLPELLVEIGFFKSKGEVRRNRPDLDKTLDKPDMLEIKIGKRWLWILVGLTEEDYKTYEETEKANGNN